MTSACVIAVCMMVYLFGVGAMATALDARGWRMDEAAPAAFGWPLTAPIAFGVLVAEKIGARK